MSSRLSSPARSRTSSLIPQAQNAQGSTQIQSPIYGVSSSRSRASSMSRSITSIASAASSVLRGPSKSHLCHVAVRVRPPNDMDSQRQCIWDVQEEDKTISLTPEYAAGSSRRRIDEYCFDSVFFGSDNYKLYQTSVYKSVVSALEGINSVVFAYGQTASGKTYTMIGTPQEPGMIPQAIEDIFEYIKHTHDREFLLKASYLEIYNETLRDLLAPEQKNLRIVEHATRGMTVSPLREEIVTSARHLMKIVRLGESNRQVEDTDFNMNSSRSHTIFQIIIESRAKRKASDESLVDSVTDVDESEITVSQLNLIDLAGSEKGNTVLERRKEGSFINRSLLTLGSVIHKLTRSGSDHIPFRDSKLTRILQPALAGNGRICVLATISPCANNLEESLNTLKFASRVRKIVPRTEYISTQNDKGLLSKYKQEIEKLRHHLVSATLKLEQERKGFGGNSNEKGVTSEERRQYEEQLLEAGRTKIALKERIQHLTKLILSSSQTSPKTLIDGESNRSSLIQGLSSIPNVSPRRRSSKGNLEFSLKPSLSLDSIHQVISTSGDMVRHNTSFGPTSTTGGDDSIDMTERLQKLTYLINKIDSLNEQEEIRTLIQKFRAGKWIPSEESTDCKSCMASQNTMAFSERDHFISKISDQSAQIDSLQKKLDDAEEFIRFSEKDHNVVQQLCEEQEKEIERLKKECHILKTKLSTSPNRKHSSPFSRASLKLILDIMHQHVQQYGDSDDIDDNLLNCIQELTDVLDSE